MPADHDLRDAPTAATPAACFTENRATLHLHGGRTPWISDGTPHQWITPAEDTNPKGVSVAYVPDMWFTAARSYDHCLRGQTTCAVAGATNNPGPGSQTYYCTNQQSARLMFYHDHAWGITRLNVYVGEAAGYLIRDPEEKAMVSWDRTGRTTTPGTIPADQIPLVIQDKTFVDVIRHSPTRTFRHRPDLGLGIESWETGRQPMPGHRRSLVAPCLHAGPEPLQPRHERHQPDGPLALRPLVLPADPDLRLQPQRGAAVLHRVRAGSRIPTTIGQRRASRRRCPARPTPPGGRKRSWTPRWSTAPPIPRSRCEPKAYRFRILNAPMTGSSTCSCIVAVNKTGHTNPGPGRL